MILFSLGKTARAHEARWRALLSHHATRRFHPRGTDFNFRFRSQLERTTAYVLSKHALLRCDSPLTIESPRENAIPRSPACFVSVNVTRYERLCSSFLARKLILRCIYIFSNCKAVLRRSRRRVTLVVNTIPRRDFKLNVGLIFISNASEISLLEYIYGLF